MVLNYFLSVSGAWLVEATGLRFPECSADLPNCILIKCALPVNRPLFHSQRSVLCG